MVPQRTFGLACSYPTAEKLYRALVKRNLTDIYELGQVGARAAPFTAHPAAARSQRRLPCGLAALSGALQRRVPAEPLGGYSAGVLRPRRVDRDVAHAPDGSPQGPTASATVKSERAYVGAGLSGNRPKWERA